jgi:glycosyltransferase involved in cell wall biosynthesis
MKEDSTESRGIIIGVDATNLRGGGGVTHLIELLRAVEPQHHGADKVIVWGGKKTLAALDDRPWLQKVNPRELDQGLLRRSLWQRFDLSRAARLSRCDVLLVPGGNYAGSFHPVVTMSRNMLPFEWRELKRYGWSWLALKLMLLRRLQSKTFRRADAVIFLTDYARRGVLEVTGPLAGPTPIIPHGVSPRFQCSPKAQRSIVEFSHANPYRVLYVSIVDQYKHQWHVVEAVAALRAEGLPVVLDLIGPAYPAAVARLEASLKQWDPEQRWARYHGPVPFAELPRYWEQADLGLFASSCENMPNILLETMAAGLPIACSNRGPMREILGAAGVYFDPERPPEIAAALRTLIESPGLRAEKAQASFAKAREYSWERCANETFEFLSQVVREKPRRPSTRA